MKQTFDNDLSKLKIKWERLGYYDSDYTYNIIDFIIILVFIGLSIKIKNGILGGLCLGMAIHQFCRFGHEIGHRSGIFNKDTMNNKVYSYFLLMLNLFLGFDGYLWKSQHRQHHEYTMHQSDCQIASDYPPVFSHHQNIYNKKVREGNLFERVLLPYQHNIGLLLVVIFGKIRLSYIYFRQIDKDKIILRKAGILIHYLFIFLCFYMRYNKYNIINAIMFLFFNNFICGILHLQLLFSHLTTEHHDNKNKNDIRQQIQHTINYTVKPYGFWHYFHVSLAYQIEHHIDPKISVQYQHKITKDVIKLCIKHELKYKSEDFVQILINYRKRLKKVSDSYRKS